MSDPVDRGVAVFLRAALAAYASLAALFCLWSAADVVWVDVLHENPERSRQHALLLLALAPLYAAVAALVFGLFPVAAAAVGAALSMGRRPRLPVWWAPAMLPVCTGLSWWQARWLDDGAQGPGATLPRLVCYQAVMLAGTWLAVRVTGPRRAPGG